MYSISNMTTQALLPNMGMDINDFVISNVDNYNEVRGHGMTSSKNLSRTVSMFLSEASEDYITRVEKLNNVSIEIIYKELIGSSQLSYADKEDIQVSRLTMRIVHAHNVAAQMH